MYVYCLNQVNVREDKRRSTAKRQSSRDNETTEARGLFGLFDGESLMASLRVQANMNIDERDIGWFKYAIV